GVGVVAASNGKIYAIGGQGVSGNSLATVEEYDPSTNAWTNCGGGATTNLCAPMPTARAALGVAAASNGRLYAAGGLTGTPAGSTAVFAAVEEYDPATNAWATRASMPTARSDLGLAAASNGRLYAIGGFTGVGQTSVVEEYDPAANTWVSRAPMPTARDG